VLTEFGAEDVETRIQSILPALQDQGILPSRALFKGDHRLPARLAISIGLFSQLAGISAILYYMNDVLEGAGLSRVSSDLQAVTIGFTSLVVTLTGRRVMDRMGRKELLLAGSCVAAMCLVAAALIFHQREGQRLLPGMLIMLITFFAVSQGRLIWVYVRESSSRTTWAPRGRP
jgi:predicted MFS family arabinose efflux permease